MLWKLFPTKNPGEDPQSFLTKVFMGMPPWGVQLYVFREAQARFRISRIHFLGRIRKQKAPALERVDATLEYFGSLLLGATLLSR